MNKLIFFLIPLLLIVSISLVPDSFAQIEKGINYDKQILSVNPDGSSVVKFTTTPERIFINGSWVDSRYTSTDTHLILETGHGSVTLNKSTCSFDFYKKGIVSGTPLFTDSIVSKMANNGTSNWNEITQISNATCETYGSEYQLIAKKYVANVGFMEYKYINTGKSFKTQLEATNLSSNTNKKFGFTQTIDLNRDNIIYGGMQRNLDNFNNSTFDRVWLENNKAKVLDFLNDISFDFDISFNRLESVYVLDTGINKSKLSFNYLHNSTIILPNDTLIIDPTFGYTSGTTYRIFSTGATSTSCYNSPYTKDSTSGTIVRANSGVSNECYFSATQWDTTSIPDSATITDVSLRYDVDTIDIGTPPGCDFNPITNKPSTATASDLFTDADDGTPYVANDSGCTTASQNKVLDLGTSADTDLKNLLSSDWFAVGGVFTSMTRTASQIQISWSQNDWELQVVYTTTPAPNAITDLSTTAIGQTTATVTFSAPNLNGESLINYMLNVTTPQASTAPTFNQNSSSTTINLSGLTLGTGYTAQASAYTLGGANWTYANVLNFTTLTYLAPSAPTLSALSESETSVRFTSINGTTNDFEMFYYGLRCVENGIGAWVTIVSNSTTPNPRIYSYTLTPGDSVTCQWRDGSLAGFGDWSNNATETTGQIGIIQEARDEHSDALMNFSTWIESQGGLYFGMGVFPMVIMLIGFMATKATVRIFTLITLASMGIIHASGYFVYPDWYWTIAILFGIVLVLGRQLRD